MAVILCRWKFNLAADMPGINNGSPIMTAYGFDLQADCPGKGSVHVFAFD